MITGEHLKLGGKALVSVMTKLFNRMLELVHIPQGLKIGIIVPIPKGTKDATIRANNRGITLLPTIGRVFEMILCKRQVNSKQYVLHHPLQGASVPHCSSLHTTLVLRETIAENIEGGSTTYVALLDMERAFDNLWIEGLLYKLYLTGMDQILWRLLHELYSN